MKAYDSQICDWVSGVLFWVMVAKKLSLVFVASRRRHTRCALVTGVQTCALPIFVLKSAALGDVQQLVDIRKQYVRCAGELHGQAGVEHVGAEIGRASCRERVCQYV